MSAGTKRMYYAMLGGLRAAPSDPCPPYTMPPPTAANIALNEVLVNLANDAMNTNLCELLEEAV